MKTFILLLVMNLPLLQYTLAEVDYGPSPENYREMVLEHIQSKKMKGDLIEIKKPYKLWYQRPFRRIYGWVIRFKLQKGEKNETWRLFVRDGKVYACSRLGNYSSSGQNLYIRDETSGKSYQYRVYNLPP